jgi:sugar lactone lactonase YvrE
VITFKPGLGQILLSEQLVEKLITIDGTSASGIVLSGGGTNRLFTVTNGGNLTLRGLTLKDGNAGDSFGGAIFNEFGVVLVDRCTLTGNTASTGGAIYSSAGAITQATTLTQCTLTGNTATFAGRGGGSAISNDAGLTSLEHCTLSGNTAPPSAPGGIVNALGAVTSVRNSIIAGNTNGDVANFDGGGAFTSLGGNLIGTGNAVGEFSESSDQTGVAAPLLAPLAGNDGPTQTMAPLPWSPALDSGIISALTPATDQRGLPRILGNAPDSGAYESAISATLDGATTIHTRIPTPWTGAVIEISTDPSFAGNPMVSRWAGLEWPAGGSFANGTRLSADFAYPSGVDHDAQGNIFIADTLNQRIRMLTPQGVVSTIAGDGSYGLSNGAGATAAFAFPSAVAVGPNGNLYAADTFNHRICKITRPAIAGGAWTVSTLAGTGSAGLVNGSGSSAQFNFPYGLDVDASGNVYVADSMNHCIRKVTPTGVVSTVAGSGAPGFADSLTPLTAQFDSPQGVVYAAGVLYVADRNNHRIRKVVPGVEVGTFAGGGTFGFDNGPAATALFHNPSSLSMSAEGDLFVSDEMNHAIRKIATDGTVTTVVGLGQGTQGYVNGDATVARFRSPAGLLVDLGGNLVVADPGNHVLRKVDFGLLRLSGTLDPNSIDASGASVSTVIDPAALGLTLGVPYYFRYRRQDGSVQTEAVQSFTLIDPPTLVTADASELTPVSARLNATVDPKESSTEIVFEYSVEPNLLPPEVVTVALSVPETGSGQRGVGTDLIGILEPGTTYYFRVKGSHSLGTTVGETLSFTLPLTTMTTQPATEITRTGARLHGTVNPQGIQTTVEFEYSTDPELAPTWLVSTLSQGATGPAPESDPRRGVAVASDGSVYFSDRDNHKILRISSFGSVTEFAGSGVAGFADGVGSAAAFDHPAGLAMDAADNLYVADEYNHRIRKITPGGEVSTLAGSGVAGFADAAVASDGQFLFPTGLAVSADGLTVYVADRGNRRVRTLSGGALATLAGDGGTIAFNAPVALALDGFGGLYVADELGHRIQRVAVSGGPVTSFAGSGLEGSVDGLGASARFRLPAGIAWDSSSQGLYVADRGNHLIRRITMAGQVSTHAGSGVAGNLDSPPGTLMPTSFSQFSSPAAVAVAVTGGPLHVADAGNAALRLVAPGPAETVAVPGSFLGANDSILSALIPLPLWPGATYYFRAVADNAGGRVEGEVLSFTTLREPQIAVLEGAIPGTTDVAHQQASPLDFGSPYLNTPVTRSMTITNLGGWDLSISTISAPPRFSVGGGAGAVIPPGGSVGFDLTFETANSGTFAGDVVISSDDPLQPTFSFPVTGESWDPPFVYTSGASNVIFDSATLYASVNPRGSPTSLWIEYSWDPEFDGFDVAVLAGSSPGYAEGRGGTAQFDEPSGMAADAFGNLYVADAANHRIRRITANGVTSVVAGTGVAGFANGLASEAQFNRPTGIAIDGDGALYVADSLNHRIRKITTDGQVATLSGLGIAGFTEGDGSAARFNLPVSLVIAADGNLWVADKLNGRIRKVTPDGTASTFADSGITLPISLARSSDGTLYVTEEGSHAIRRISAGGVVDDLVDSAAGLSGPTGLTVDKEDRILVADTGNHVLRRISPAGVVRTLAGLVGSAGVINGPGDVARFNQPIAVAANASGELFVSERTFGTIRKLTSTAQRLLVDSNLTSLAYLPLSVQAPRLADGVTYYFRAIATNKGGTTMGSTDTFSLGPFGRWQFLKFGTDAGNLLIAGPEANPAGDGTCNLLKYAFGMDPHANSRIGLPEFEFEEGAMSVTYNQPIEASDVYYLLEFSNDLIDWFSLLDFYGSADYEVLSNDGINRRIRESLTWFPADEPPPLFFRLRVGLP